MPPCHRLLLRHGSNPRTPSRLGLLRSFRSRLFPCRPCSPRPWASPFHLFPLPILPASSACVRRVRYSPQCLSFSGSAPPPGQVHSLLLRADDLQMKHFFSSTGNPGWWKWQLTPRLHTPFCQEVQGCAHGDKGLLSRAAIGGCTPADGVSWDPAARAALFFSASFS